MKKHFALLGFISILPLLIALIFPILEIRHFILDLIYVVFGVFVLVLTYTKVTNQIEPDPPPKAIRIKIKEGVTVKLYGLLGVCAIIGLIAMTVTAPVYLSWATYFYIVCVIIFLLLLSIAIVR